MCFLFIYIEKNKLSNTNQELFTKTISNLHL